MTFLLIAAASYVVGSFPTGYLMAKGRKVDLRQVGSGNLGATNVFRALGWKAALPVALLDVLKGFLPTLLLPAWLAGAEVDMSLLRVAAGLGAIAGHVWSFFLGFRGGKGVATGAGVYLALSPAAFGLAAVVWLGLVGLTRTVSMGSMAAALTLPAFLGIVGHDIWGTDRPVFLFACLTALFVLYTHRANIGRLLRGEELRLGSRGRDG